MVKTVTNYVVVDIIEITYDICVTGCLKTALDCHDYDLNVNWKNVTPIIATWKEIHVLNKEIRNQWWNEIYQEVKITFILQ